MAILLQFNAILCFKSLKKYPVFYTLTYVLKRWQDMLFLFFSIQILRAIVRLFF